MKRKPHWLTLVGQCFTVLWLLTVVAVASWLIGVTPWLLDRAHDLGILSPRSEGSLGGALLGFVLGTFAVPAYCLEEIGVPPFFFTPSRPEPFGFPSLQRTMPGRSPGYCR